MLHGRGPERAAIEAVLEAARRSRSGSLAIRGESGVGKSALLTYAVEHAEGFRVLRAAGTQSETGMPYAALQWLLRPALDRIDVLPDVQAAALSGALGLAANEGADRFLIGLAVLSLLSDLAESEPVLGIVDDLQWLDAESADALRFVTRRLDAEGIALILATTEAAALEGGSTELTVVGLDRVSSDALLIERSGTTLAPDVRAYLWEHTHGNPSR